jgi:predicted transposase YdaD
MFTLSDLKHTRFYQDVFAEGKAEGEAEAQAKAQAKAQTEKQRNKVAIFRIFSMGFATEDIATIFDLPVSEVAAIITESQQEQSEPNQSN